MLKRHMIFTLIFLIIAIANLFAQLDRAGLFSPYVKPLICISLAICIAAKTNMSAGFNRLILAGLCLSLTGDCLLLVNKSIYFLYGLIAFLLAHIAYSFAFFRDFKNDPQATKVYGHVMLFATGVFSLSYYSWIRDYLNDLRVPVMAYMFVISIMVILAGYRYRRVNLLSFRMVYIGGILFVISDLILAYDKFITPFPFSGIAIMCTYMLAQYLITMGAVERVVMIENKSEQ